MKILHVIPSLGPLRGGPSSSVRSMVRSLARAGFDVHVAATDDNGSGRLDVPLGRPVVEDGVTCWYFPRQTRFYTVSWPLTRWLAAHLGEYRVLHVHSLFSYAPLPAALWATRRAVPYVVRPLGTLMRWGMQRRRPQLKRLSFAILERQILEHAALVHYTSEQERLETEALGGRLPCAVIPLGIDLTAFAHLPSAGTFRSRYASLHGRTVVLFLSRLDPVKGLDLLLPVFARVHRAHPEAVLVLAGSGTPEYTARLRSTIEALGMKDAVVFSGFLDGPQKLAALVDCDVFVLPSYSENFGIAAVEAMACGKPVIVSDRVPVHREIASHQAGVVSGCDAEDLAEALDQLVADARLRQRAGANGVRLVREAFSVEVVTAKLAQVYSALA